MLNEQQSRNIHEHIVVLLLIASGWEALGGMSSGCTGFRFLGLTLLILGVTYLILIYMGKAAPILAMIKDACCNLPLSLVVLALGIFALVVSSKGGGESIPGRSYKDYRLDSYSKWMQHKVGDAHNWGSYYKKAIVEANVCHKFSKEYEFDSLDALHKRKLTPLESSCCMPPEDCNFDYTSPTVWVKPENGTTYTDIDCKRWDNDPNTLCYDCQTCKAAFLQDVTTHYFIAGIILLLPSIISMMCCSCMIFTMCGLGAMVAGLGLATASSDDTAYGTLAPSSDDTADGLAPSSDDTTINTSV